MTRDEIVKYLQVLGEALAREGLQGEVILTGGAVMTIIHSARDMTKDLGGQGRPHLLYKT